MKNSDRKIKVYIDALPLAEDRMSGIGHLILEQTRALAKNPHLDIRLVVPLRKRGKILRYNIRNTTVKTLPLLARMASVLTRMRLLPPVDLWLGRGVYLFMNYRNWPLALSKSLTYCHDTSFLLHPETVSPPNLQYLRGNIRLWTRRADLVLTLSKATKQEIIEQLHLPKRKIRVVPCGIDPAVYYPRTKSETEKTKKKYGITTQRYILYVGNLEPRKNLNRLLDAYRELPAELRKKYALVLVGGGGWLNQSTLAKIEQFAKEGENIFHPKTYVKDEDLPALFSGAELVVQPSLYEGFGIPPLQAMACGVPVAGSDIPSIREVVGNNAVVFDPYSVGSITKALQAGLTDKKLRKQLVSGGKNRAAQLTWEHSATLLAETIKEVNRG